MFDYNCQTPMCYVLVQEQMNNCGGDDGDGDGTESNSNCMIMLKGPMWILLYLQVSQPILLLTLNIFKKTNRFVFSTCINIYASSAMFSRRDIAVFKDLKIIWMRRDAKHRVARIQDYYRFII